VQIPGFQLYDNLNGNVAQDHYKDMLNIAYVLLNERKKHELIWAGVSLQITRGGGNFEAFRAAGAIGLHCTDGVKSTLPRLILPQTRICNAHVSTSCLAA